MAKLTVEVNGLDELVKKLDPSMLNEPMKEFFTRATTELKENIKVETPSFSGALRGSLQRSVDSSRLPLYGKVTSRLFYALFVEAGTQPHFPPRGAVGTWAAAHGMDVGVLARTIGATGTKGRYMFRKGEEKSAGQIDGWLSEAEQKIVNEWER